MAGINPAANNPESEEWLWRKDILRLVNHQLRIDFYYTLLCEVELDVADHLTQHGLYEAHREQLVEWGFVGDIAPGSPSRRHERDRPLIRLFEVWKYRLSEINGCEISYRKMASYLPLPRNCSEEEFSSRAFETPGNHKYGKLKRWRNGTIPDLSDFEIFIARLCEGHDSEHYLAWMKAQVALAWGRLINEEEALASIFITHPDLQRFNAIGSYSKYWHRYQKQVWDHNKVGNKSPLQAPFNNTKLL